MNGSWTDGAAYVPGDERRNRFHPLRGFFALSLHEASFQKRAFVAGTRSAQQVLETAGRAFIGGYNAALATANEGELASYVHNVPAHDRGFAVEGAAMGAALQFGLFYQRRLLPALLGAFDAQFTYLTHVGVGWVLSRVPWSETRLLATLDPVHRWLAYDGLGFHDTFFHHQRVLGGWRRRRRGYAASAYEQGVGRALWFVSGGSVKRAAALIAAMPVERQGHLWSGLGLALAYAGPIDEIGIDHAVRSAGSWRPWFAQGVAFACAARTIAGYVPHHTDRAARTVWDAAADDVAGYVHDVRARLPVVEEDSPRYELWRQRVAEHAASWASAR